MTMAGPTDQSEGSKLTGQVYRLCKPIRAFHGGARTVWTNHREADGSHLEFSVIYSGVFHDLLTLSHTVKVEGPNTSTCEILHFLSYQFFEPLVCGICR